MAPLAFRETKAIKAARDLAVHRVRLALLVLLVLRVLKDHRALGLKAHKAMRELQDFKATTAHKAAAEFLERRVTPERKDFRVIRELLALSISQRAPAYPAPPTSITTLFPLGPSSS